MRAAADLECYLFAAPKLARDPPARSLRLNVEQHGLGTLGQPQPANYGKFQHAVMRVVRKTRLHQDPSERPVSHTSSEGPPVLPPPRRPLPRAAERISRMVERRGKPPLLTRSSMMRPP